MRSRMFVLPVALLAIGCTGGVKDADSSSASDTLESTPIAPPDSTAGTSGTPASSGRRVGSLGSGSGSASGAGSGARSGGGQTTTTPARRPPSGGGRTPTVRGGGSDTTPAVGERGDTSVTRSSAADSARGIVAVVGTSFESRVVLRPAGGGRPVTLIGPLSRNMGRLSGADVWAIGTGDDHGQLRVSRYVVRSVDGNLALDGTLIARGAQLYVVTRDGEQHAIENAPASLKDHVGARVWVTGGGKGPVVYGVIEERR